MKKEGSEVDPGEGNRSKRSAGCKFRLLFNLVKRSEKRRRRKQGRQTRTSGRGKKPNVRALGQERDGEGKLSANPKTQRELTKQERCPPMSVESNHKINPKFVEVERAAASCESCPTL